MSTATALTSSLATRTTTRTTTSRRLALVAGLDPSARSSAEIEAWLEEVAPVLAALQHRSSAPSAGQRAWLTTLASDCGEVLSHVDDEALAAELAGEPTDHLSWLYTRISVLQDASIGLALHRWVA